MDELRLWLPIAIAILVFVWNLRLHFSGVRKDEFTKLGSEIKAVASTNSAAIAAVRAEIEEHKEAGDASRAELRERMVQLEKTLEQMPSKDSVHQLALAVTEIRGAINAQGETMKAIGATASRVETFLLERNK